MDFPNTIISGVSKHKGIESWKHQSSDEYNGGSNHKSEYSCCITTTYAAWVYFQFMQLVTEQVTPLLHVLGSNNALYKNCESLNNGWDYFKHLKP